MRLSARGGWAVAVAAVALVLPALALPAQPATADPARSPDGAAVPSAPSVPATAGQPAVRRDPGDILPRTLTGPRAAAALSARELAGVAERHDLSAARLREVLADRSVRVSPQGRIFYVDEAPTRTNAQAAAPAPVDPARTFTLHSNPGATRVLFLDFDGSAADGADWGLPNAPRAPFSVDGTAAFSAPEHALVQDVWARVAEDYAPFDIDVTTQDPGAEGLVRSSSSDTSYGARMLITQDDAALGEICGSCAGVAYLHVFTDGDDGMTSDPLLDGWVFADMNWFDPSLLASTISHEAGHTLGLEHDGGPGVEYYAGHGNWAPLMGSGFRAIDQWSRGEYPGATQTEDDLAIIASHVPRSSDDHGDTPATATDLGAQSFFSTRGTIGTRADKDVIRIDRSSCAGTLEVDALPAASGPNLDLRLRVLDASMSEVAVADPASSRSGAPATGLDAHVSVAVPAGVYHLELDGVGAHGASDGYTDYGSLGAWTLEATGCSTAPGEPVAPSVPRNVVAAVDNSALSATLSWQTPADPGGAEITGYSVRIGSGAPVLLPATARNRTFTGLAESTTYTLRVRAHNSAGAGPEQAVQASTSLRRAGAVRNIAFMPYLDEPGVLTFSWSAPTALHHPLRHYCVSFGPGECIESTSTRVHIGYFEPGEVVRATVWAVTSAGDGVPASLDFVVPRVPGPVRSLAASSTSTSVRLIWAAPSGDAPTHHRMAINGRVRTTLSAAARSYTFTGLSPGKVYRVAITPLIDGVAGSTQTLSKGTPTTRPGAPRIGTAYSGARGGTVSATARWGAPTSNGGTAITSYRVTAHRLDSRGRIVSRTTRSAKASARALAIALPRGRYRFTVVALNRKGTSKPSNYSRIVTAQ